MLHAHHHGPSSETDTVRVSPLTPPPLPQPSAFCVYDRDSCRVPVSGLMQELSFWDGLLSLSTMSRSSMLSQLSVLGSFLRLNNIPVCVCVCVCVYHVCLCVQLSGTLELHPRLGCGGQCLAHGCTSVRTPRPFLHVLREALCKWSCVCPRCSAAWLPPPCIVCDTHQVAEPCSFV